MRNRRQSAVAVIALAALAGAVMAACGGDDDRDEADSTPATSTIALLDNDAQSRLNAGDPAPEFSLPTSDGGVVSLADYRDQQPVLLFFHMADG